MIVRSATIDDVPEILGLLAELLETAHDHASGIPDGVRVAELLAEMEQNPAYASLVAVVDERVAGFVKALFYRSLSAGAQR